jgi:hypothetical protein
MFSRFMKNPLHPCPPARPRNRKFKFEDENLCHQRNFWMDDWGKAAVNAPHCKRFARCEDARWSRQHLECGDFSTAFRTFRHPNSAGAMGGRGAPANGTDWSRTPHAEFRT